MNRKILNPLFALLIFVAHLNCVVEHQLICAVPEANTTLARQTTQMPGDQVPVDSESCEHGCICKGATLASHFVFVNFGAGNFCFQLVAEQPFSVVLDRLELRPAHSAKIPICGWPLRALDRCALLQTFSI
jgi:hypothetical protein